jgi:hypothetical protein
MKIMEKVRAYKVRVWAGGGCRWEQILCGEGIRFGMAAGGCCGGVLWGGSELYRESRWGRMRVAGEWNNAVGAFRWGKAFCEFPGFSLLDRRGRSIGE